MKSILSQKIFTLSSGLLCLIAWNFIRVDAAPIRIGGSDLMEAPLAKRLETFSQEEGIPLSHDFSGSTPAIQSLQSDRLDLAIVAFPDDSELPNDAGLHHLPFAYQIAIIAVHESNPIEQVALDQLATVFGKQPDTSTPYWELLGLYGRWGLREIHPFATNHLDTVAFQLFKYKTLKGMETPPNLTFLPDAAALSKQLEQDTLAIGVLPGPPEGEGIKVLAVAVNEANYAFEPSESNVFYGDYPIRLPFYIVFPTAAQPRLKELLKHLLSPETAESLRQNAFVPAPEDVRSDLILSLDEGG